MQGPTSEISKMVFPKPLPKQLPWGFSEDKLRAMADKAMNAFIVIQILLSFFIKQAIKRMWQLFFFLQMMCAFTLYQVSYPVSADIFLQKFK